MYLHDFIDVDSDFNDYGKYPIFTGITSMKSGYRKVFGNTFEVKVIPRLNGFKGNYLKTSTDNMVGGTNLRTTHTNSGEIVSEVVIQNRSGKGLIVFEIQNNNQAATELINYIRGK